MKAPQVPRLALEGVTKFFPGVVANDAISLAIAPGEIHALLGENGAGKSTLVKIVYGLLAPDDGRLLWNGEPVVITSPKDARRLGIAMVFQHFSLFDALTVAENIALGIDARLGRAALRARIGELAARHGLAIDLDARIEALSVGERQRVEILRALMADPSLLILDEPTSVLTPQEAEALFATLKGLAAGGCSVLYISHKLDEIRQLCDSATVLRGGRVVGAADPSATSAARLAEMMIGETPGKPPRAARRASEVALSITGLSLAAEEAGGIGLSGVSFEVRAGEIFGVAGVAGNGQGLLLSALSGELRAPAATIRLGGRDVSALGAQRRRALGLAALPEERNGHAAVPAMSLAENAILTARAAKRLAPHGWLRLGRARAYAAEVIARFGVRAAGPDAPAATLSGGNLQKFAVGREILQAPKVLVVAQPTWGVDAGAQATIHAALVDLAANGSAVVLISQDLDELLLLSHRLAVIAGGRLSAPMPAEAASAEALGLLMGGAHPEERAADALEQHPEAAHAG